MPQQIELKQIDEVRWHIPRSGNMLTDGMIYADAAMIPHITSDQSLVQVANVACLPGIVGNSLAMPDIHWGYGFPIGGVAAFDIDEGVVSPGGVGYDINCGVRVYATALHRSDMAQRLEKLVEQLARNIPSGVGSERRDLKLSAADYRRVLLTGARWAVEHGFGAEEDLHHIEDYGCIQGADPDVVSEKAYERGRQQLGTLGSGNHFIEIAVVDEVYDQIVAQRFGLVHDSIAITVHTGSRGFGYQVCDDFLKVMLKAAQKYKIELPDRQLCCAPLTSPEGRHYLSAMAAAANYAFANRQIIGHWIRGTCIDVLGISPSTLRMTLVYDICHNIAKIEDHILGGTRRTLCVHRKGAT
ncbi:MAG: RtcB family protein, partial [Desulfobacterota bacterium]|nr:RtcB family protein [Thermodesulfobacteriota bacterium]